jgi:hypothetical protein
MEGWRWVLKHFGNEYRRNSEKIIFQKSKFRSRLVHQAPSRLCHCTEKARDGSNGLEEGDWILIAASAMHAMHSRS